MSGRALVDTNVVIGLFAGDPSAIQAVEGKDAVFLCVPILGELRYGALASSRISENLARLDHFSRALIILPCDELAAVHYSEVKFSLRKKGRPIPENDVWIAAVARQHDLTLITRDLHFENIEGLDLELVS